DGGGALWPDQFPIGDELEVAIHEMSVRAVFGLGALLSADGHPRVEPPQIREGVLHRRTAIAQMPMELLVHERRQELVLRVGKTRVEGEDWKRVVDRLFF